MHTLNKPLWLLLLLWGGMGLAACSRADSFTLRLKKALQGRSGVLVFLDTASGQTWVSDTGVAAQPMPPCSTFKIWNTLIGAENGILSDPDTPFYTWDGVSRAYPGWNQNLSLKEAFQVSCVPAFQKLARDIGLAEITRWLALIEYGDQNISQGLDSFWLPRPGTLSLLISPLQQTEALSRLLMGKIPVSQSGLSLLRKIMHAGQTPAGTLYGKTGSGNDYRVTPTQPLGWYTGFVESEGRTLVFACLLQGEGSDGPAARTVISNILQAGLP